MKVPVVLIEIRAYNCPPFSLTREFFHIILKTLQILLCMLHVYIISFQNLIYRQQSKRSWFPVFICLTKKTVISGSCKSLVKRSVADTSNYKRFRARSDSRRIGALAPYQKRRSRFLLPPKWVVVALIWVKRVHLVAISRSTDKYAEKCTILKSDRQLKDLNGEKLAKAKSVGRIYALLRRIEETTSASCAVLDFLLRATAHITSARFLVK